MKLEKSNETCWSIKRKNKPGTFSLRFTESGGEIIKVSITLNDTIHETKFEMSVSEFENFYSIVSSFRDLIKPNGVQKQELGQFSDESLSNYDEFSKQSSSNLKMSTEPFDFDKIVADLDQMEYKNSELSKVAVGGEGEKGKSKKTELKETDWDPW
ncbi:MAG: hypothetical protein ACTSWX_10615 [Promethearchaeota archaeon]